MTADSLLDKKTKDAIDTINHTDISTKWGRWDLLNKHGLASTEVPNMEGAIAALKADPSKAPLFDKQFGDGASKWALSR